MHGVPSRITSSIPAAGSIRRRAIAAATATIGRLLRAVPTAPTVCTSTVAACIRVRVPAASTTGTVFAV